MTVELGNGHGLENGLSCRFVMEKPDPGRIRCLTLCRVKSKCSRNTDQLCAWKPFSELVLPSNFRLRFYKCHHVLPRSARSISLVASSSGLLFPQCNRSVCWHSEGQVTKARL